MIINHTMNSIFDIIEEQKSKPEVFNWSKTLPSFNLSDVLCEGVLTTTNLYGILKLHKYILTSQGLFKYKVGFLFTLVRRN